MSKGRLVVVSNRLPTLKDDTAWKRGAIPTAGGLVSALLPVMESNGKGLWMGWSGKSVSDSRSGTLAESDHPLVRMIGMDLSEKEVNGYYNGFCNRTLWPMFHCFQARVRERNDEYFQYGQVNERFSRALIGYLEPNDTVWIHDYHLIPLGRHLRRAGFKGPLGFFLHIPFPPLEMIEILNDPLGFMDAWLDYDLVGFHTERYQENYFEVLERLMLGVREGDRVFAGKRRQRTVVCPIGITPAIFDPAREVERQYRRKSLRAELPGVSMVLSVDRLDYTKGIPERMESFEYFLKNYPQWRRQVTMIQICSPSRTRVKEYIEQKAAVDFQVGRMNGEYSEHDWMPIRYLYRTYSQLDLARFYRDADVALVTPLRDGMNLVAVEYVAAQRPESPGVLVLSRFTGVAEHLTEAVLVNPFLPESVAEGLDRALSMGLRERRDRYHSMFGYIAENTALKWAHDFIEALEQSRDQNSAPPPNRPN